MKFKNHIAGALIVLFALTWVGCDDNGSDPMESDDASELFVGDWTLTGADDDSGSRLGDLANRYNSIVAAFSADTSFTMTLDSNNESVPDVNLSGTYSATITESLMRLSAEFNSVPVTLTFVYLFTDETNSEVGFSTTSTQTQSLNFAIGTDFVGPTTLTFARVEN